MHPYHTRQVLDRSPFLSSLAEVAVSTTNARRRAATPRLPGSALTCRRGISRRLTPTATKIERAPAPGRP